jgi:phosphoribosylformylglycinamidine synthase
MSEIRASPQILPEIGGLALVGGFANGDDLKAGKVMAIELLAHAGEELEKFVATGRPIIGICNGFQALVRTGLLPFGKLGVMEATLARNDAGSFRARWEDLVVEGASFFARRIVGRRIRLMIAHGEGKFTAPSDVIEAIERGGQVVLRYCENPNGSTNRIAGITDPTLRIFGLMPHPERCAEVCQYPNWRRGEVAPYGLPFFENMVDLAAAL